MYDTMIGARLHTCRGGANCDCTGDAHGHGRKISRRTAKRRERQAVRRMIALEIAGAL